MTRDLCVCVCVSSFVRGELLPNFADVELGTDLYRLMLSATFVWQAIFSHDIILLGLTASESA